MKTNTNAKTIAAAPEIDVTSNDVSAIAATRDPHKDMLASFRMEGETEIAEWFHKGNHVFTVRTAPDGSMIYRSVVE